MVDFVRTQTQASSEAYKNDEALEPRARPFAFPLRMSARYLESFNS